MSKRSRRWSVFHAPGRMGANLLCTGLSPHHCPICLVASFGVSFFLLEFYQQASEIPSIAQE